MAEVAAPQQQQINAETTVVVRGIPREWKEEQMNQVFPSATVKILNTRVIKKQGVVQPLPPTKTAFIEFADKAGADAALQNPKLNFQQEGGADGELQVAAYENRPPRVMKPRVAKVAAAAPAAAKKAKAPKRKAQVKDTDYAVVAKGFTQEFNKDLVNSVFSQYGDIQKVVLLKRRIRKNIKTEPVVFTTTVTAFVLFKEQAAQQAALANPEVTIKVESADVPEVTIKIAEFVHREPRAPRTKAAAGVATAKKAKKTNKKRKVSLVTEPTMTVVIAKIPVATTNDDIKNAVSATLGENVSVAFPRIRKNNTFKVAFVQFATDAAAAAAVAKATVDIADAKAEVRAYEVRAPREQAPVVDTVVQ